MSQEATQQENEYDVKWIECKSRETDKWVDKESEMPTAISSD